MGEKMTEGALRVVKYKGPMASVGKEKVYLDTSVVSAYADEKKPTRQRATQQWWNRQAFERYVIHVSEVTVAELEATPDMGKRRQFKRLIKGIPILPVTVEATQLAEAYVATGVMAEEDYNDAMHLAVATVQGMDIVASWNFQHLVNHDTRRTVKGLNMLKGYRDLQIESPLELGGGELWPK